MTASDAPGIVDSRPRLEQFKGACPRPLRNLDLRLEDARDGGGVAEATRGLVDPGQEVQSFVIDLGPFFSTGNAFYPPDGGDGGAEFVSREMAGAVSLMFDEFRCNEVVYPAPQIVGELRAEPVPGGVKTGVFGFATQYPGPFDEGSNSRGIADGAMPWEPEHVVFDEGVAPEDQRLFVEGRYTVVDGTVLVGVEVQSTHEEYVDVDELLQVMVDRVEAEPLPTHAPDDDLLEE